MNGVLNLLKPPGISSGQAVGAVRRLYDTKRVGHTGTLDPGAAGVLPICVGRATKLADYIMRGEKEYIGEVTFGAETDTLDSYGRVTATSDKTISKEELISILPRFIGRILQKPPAYSALKQDGVPLYKLARKGEMVQKPPREVTICELEWLGGRENRFLLRIRCSKGTYIRTLAADMGRALKSCAYLSFLLRTETCGFSVAEATTLDELEAMAMAGREASLAGMEQAVGFLPKIKLPEHLHDIARSGMAIDLRRAGIENTVQDGREYTVWRGKELICISRANDGLLKMQTMIKID